MMQSIKGGVIPDIYFYANSKRVAISSGWSFTVAFEPTQAFPSSTSFTVTFPDNNDGNWCRTAGSLTVVGVSATPIDISGTGWDIDAPLPGGLSATCIQGAGPGSSDRVVISGIGPLTQGVTYGVELSGNVGVLGTSINLGGHRIDIDVDNGALNDNFWFQLELIPTSSVNITANVLPMPECSVNTDCSYPIEICDGLQQCASCTANSQCNSGDICVAGMCTRDLSCNVNSDCFFPSEICGPGSECQACTLDTQCGAGNRCMSGMCEAIPPAECTTNAQCNYPTNICSPNGNCVACTGDAQCNSGDQCVSGVCQTIPPAQCTTNSQCNYPNQICNSTNNCVPCITDWQCNVGHACVNNVCQESFECLLNADCRFPDEICTIDNKCEQCSTDTQCGAGNTCTNGRCIAIPPAQCSVNSQCGYPEEVCVDGQCKSCETSLQCSNGDICERGECEPPEQLECTTNAHCGYPDEICDANNICTECRIDSECNFGDVCREGECIFIPSGQTPVSRDRTWVENVVIDIIESIGIEFETIREVMEESSVLAPVAATVTLVTTSAVGLSFINLTLMDAPVLILRGLLGLLTLLGIRSKGQPYGYVYNAITKEPLSSALIRIFKFDDDGRKKLITTSVTDAFGVFDAELEPGNYQLYISKSGFGFPSKIVKSLADYPMNNLYYGDQFNVETESPVYYSIPIDPTKQGIFSVIGAVIRERLTFFVKFIQLTLLLFGVVFSLLLYLSVPSLPNLLILLLYVPSIALTIYSFKNIEPAKGVTTDVDGNPLPEVTIGLYDIKESRFITKRVTDSNGKFRFVVPRGEYRLELLDEPYEVVSQELKVLDSKKSKDMIVVTSRLVLRRPEVVLTDTQNPSLTPLNNM